MAGTTVLDAIQVQLVSDVARDVIAQTAPEELALFRVTSEAYFRDPDKAFGERAGDEDLAFGAELATVVAPIVLAVVTEVVRFLTAEVAKSLRAEGSAVIGDYVRHLFRKFRPVGGSGPAPPPLTPAQLADVRRRAYEKARQLKIAEAQAEQLADSMIAMLATAGA